jgi:hypothetical protein
MVFLIGNIVNLIGNTEFLRENMVAFYRNIGFLMGKSEDFW